MICKKMTESEESHNSVKNDEAVTELNYKIQINAVVIVEVLLFFNL